jgi:AraC-like DNA-binding protein
MGWNSTLSTHSVAAGQRVEYWNAAACSSLLAQRADPHDATVFSGHMRIGDIGGLRLAEISSTPATIWHSREHVARAAAEHFLLRIQRAGESVTSQVGREVRLFSGDFTLCDARRPYSLHFTEPASFLTLRIDRAMLERHIAMPERLMLVRVPGDTGLGLLVSRLLRRIAEAFDEAINPFTYPRISNAVMEMLAGAYADLGGESARAGSTGPILRARIIEFVEGRLGDASLSPTQVARQFGISRRYLHGLFELGEETLASYIWRRRLERARFALLDERRRDCRLTQLAAEHGFKTLAHFSRCFRAEFGCSPRQLRRHRRTSD